VPAVPIFERAIGHGIPRELDCVALASPANAARDRKLKRESRSSDCRFPLLRLHDLPFHRYWNYSPIFSLALLPARLSPRASRRGCSAGANGDGRGCCCGTVVNRDPAWSRRRRRGRPGRQQTIIVAKIPARSSPIRAGRGKTHHVCVCVERRTPVATLASHPCRRRWD